MIALRILLTLACCQYVLCQKIELAAAATENATGVDLPNDIQRDPYDDEMAKDEIVGQQKKEVQKMHCCRTEMPGMHLLGKYIEKEFKLKKFNLLMGYLWLNNYSIISPFIKF
jgi:hypothetical protein